VGLSIRTNIDSLVAQGNLRRASNDLSKTYERLSSGMRINSASDDPAGLALASKLEADTRIASVAVRNANDGISVTSIADSALDEINNSLSRMLELAMQSANTTQTTAQRSSINLEFVALGSEIDRISRTVSFNNITLLSNSRDISIQVGMDSTSNSLITIPSVRATLDSLGLAATGGSSLVYSLMTTSDAGSAFASTNSLSAIQNAMTSLTTVRGTIGASQSRLTRALGYLEVARENFAAAASKIRDIDVAEETAKMVALQVIQQSATAVMAQANQTPRLVLDLLK
jgi:flagellin